MPPEVHTFLNECQENAKNLVSEIEKFKRFSEISQTAADSLSSIDQAMHAVLKQIEPFTALRFRRFQMQLYIWCGINSLLLVLLLIIELLK